MSRCPESEHIEPWLDGELGLEPARAFERHLAGCPACAAEHAAFASLFVTLRHARVADPGPRLTERILDRVVPSRVRRRQVTMVGWCYTALSAATTFAFISWVVRPETPIWLGRLLTTAYGRVMDTALFAIGALTATILRVQQGLGLLEALSGWLVPVSRALRLLVGDPMIAAPLWAAIATCGLLFLWMRPRPLHIVRGRRHVGILAF
jgi:predicted anti-sigma-YlaC factor YlaD